MQASGQENSSRHSGKQPVQYRLRMVYTPEAYRPKYKTDNFNTIIMYIGEH